MPRSRGNGRRTIEQTRSIDVRHLREAAFIGKAVGNWYNARNKLFCAGIRPKHWNDAGVTLDAQTLQVTWVPWHFGGPAWSSRLADRPADLSARPAGI